jgi:hypothetical protein
LVRAPGAQQVIRVPVNSVGARHLARTIKITCFFPEQSGGKKSGG